MLRRSLRCVPFLLLALPTPGYQSAKLRAILIGINQYNPAQGTTLPVIPHRSASRKALSSGDVRHWDYQDLQGAINDVNMIEGMLRAKDFGFGEDDIVKLITPETTTADNILATLHNELVTNAHDGDTRLVYYSGHGNFIRNLALGKSAQDFGNLYDQTLVPSDNWQGAVDVRDKELSKILWDSAQKGVTVTFIADSCHSGSLTRGAGLPHGRARSNSGIRGAINGKVPEEPIISDPPFAANGQAIDPEDVRGKVSILKISAAQDNQEAMELRLEKNEVHGAMTMALVKAVREEGPHASMSRIVERMTAYLKDSGVSQTPVIGGKERSQKDLLGREASQAPFTILATKVADGEVLLLGGESIGLYPDSELRQTGTEHAHPATLTVLKPLGLAASAAKITSGSVNAGDRFEVTRWAGPADPNLKIYVPPQAPPDVVLWAVAAFGPLRDDPSVHWVDEPAQESPTDILRWGVDGWSLDHIPAPSKTRLLGQAPSAADLKKALSPDTRLFVLFPPSTDLSAALDLGSGSTYPGIARVRGAEADSADYRLFGRLAGNSVEYAWFLADAELASRQLTTAKGRGGIAGSKPAAANQSAVISSLPSHTKWFSGTNVGDSLTKYAVRLGKVRAWLTLSAAAGRTIFPYHLVLRRVSDKRDLSFGVLHESERYKLYLSLDAGFRDPTTERRWVYIFAIDQDGKGTLLFPALGKGNLNNRLPLLPPTAKDVPVAPATPSIQASDLDWDLEIGPPFGVDTYIMLTSVEQIPDPGILDFDGVETSKGVSRGAGVANPLEQLLDGYGNSRGAIANRAPTEWSVGRIRFQSVPK